MRVYTNGFSDGFSATKNCGIAIYGKTDSKRFYERWVSDEQRKKIFELAVRPALPVTADPVLRLRKSFDQWNSLSNLDCTKYYIEGFAEGEADPKRAERHWLHRFDPIYSVPLVSYPNPEDIGKKYEEGWKRLAEYYKERGQRPHDLEEIPIWLRGYYRDYKLSLAATKKAKELDLPDIAVALVLAERKHLRGDDSLTVNSDHYRLLMMYCR